MSRGLAIASALLFAGMVAGSAALALMPPPEPGHSRFHIGCLDHNHGPKWHAGHGKSLVPVSRFARPDDGDEPPARQRR